MLLWGRPCNPWVQGHSEIAPENTGGGGGGFVDFVPDQTLCCFGATKGWSKLFLAFPSKKRVSLLTNAFFPTKVGPSVVGFLEFFGQTERSRVKTRGIAYEMEQLEKRVEARPFGLAGLGNRVPSGVGVGLVKTRVVGRMGKN